MPRLRSRLTGSIVNVSDETAAVLSGYDPVDGDGSGAPKGNASRDEWAAYADSVGVRYDEDAKRDDIKAAVDAAGK